jgi:hypothetical protein
VGGGGVGGYGTVGGDVCSSCWLLVADLWVLGFVLVGVHVWTCGCRVGVGLRRGRWH